MKQLILRNKGIGFQTFFGLENEIINNRLRYIPLNDNNGIYCDLGLYARKGHYLSTATDALSGLLQMKSYKEAKLDNKHNLKSTTKS